MLALTNEQFEAQRDERAQFTIQVIANGSVKDSDAGNNYTIGVTTIRVNYVALNMWVESQLTCWPPKDYGFTKEDGIRIKTKSDNLRFDFNQRIKNDLGIDDNRESYTIHHITGEFFTVLTMRREED